MEWLGYIYITRTYYSSYCLHYQSNLWSDKKVLDKSKIILDKSAFLCYTNNRKKKGDCIMRTINEIIKEAEAEGWDTDRFTSVDGTEVLQVYTSGWTYSEYEFDSNGELIEAWSHSFGSSPERLYPIK